MARPKKEINESVQSTPNKLPELENVTKDGFPLQYSVEERFQAINRNFTKIMEYLNAQG